MPSKNNKFTKVKIISFRLRNPMLVNSLIEKQKYIYFRSGPFGTANPECGTEYKKMKKENLTWTKIGKQCNNKLDIWEIK